MSLHHAILGLLTVMPMTGYDLKTQAFDNTIVIIGTSCHGMPQKLDSGFLHKNPLSNLLSSSTRI